MAAAAAPLCSSDDGAEVASTSNVYDANELARLLSDFKACGGDSFQQQSQWLFPFLHEVIQLLRPAIIVGGAFKLGMHCVDFYSVTQLLELVLRMRCRTSVWQDAHVVATFTPLEHLGELFGGDETDPDYISALRILRQTNDRVKHTVVFIQYPAAAGGQIGSLLHDMQWTLEERAHMLEIKKALSKEEGATTSEAMMKKHAEEVLQAPPPQAEEEEEPGVVASASSLPEGLSASQRKRRIRKAKAALTKQMLESKKIIEPGEL